MELLKKVSEKDILKDDPLRNFHVWQYRYKITLKDVNRLQQTIEHAKTERDIQCFLEKYPIFLVQHLGGGHGRWCIPQKRLGAEFVPDFIIGERSSLGFKWCGIELKSPKAKLFNKNGNPSAVLTHAIRQITDWRIWLTNNIDYARRTRDKQGLGLTDVDGNMEGLVLIGRRDILSTETTARRSQMCKDLNIEIHTYDWLVEQSKWRCSALKKSKKAK